MPKVSRERFADEGSWLQFNANEVQRRRRAALKHAAARPPTPKELAERERLERWTQRLLVERPRWRVEAKRKRERYSDRVRATWRRWYARHRESVCAKVRAYKRAHREEIALKAAIYRMENLDRIRARDAAYRAARRDEINAKRREKRAPMTRAKLAAKRERDRNVLALRAQGLTFKAIGEVLGIKLSLAHKICSTYEQRQQEDGAA